jgi:hypothetical protein
MPDKAKNKFISNCIKNCMDEDKHTQEQSSAICYSKWKQKANKSVVKSLLTKVTKYLK